MSSGSEKFPGNKAQLGFSQRRPGTRGTPAAFRRPFGNEAIARDEFFGATVGGPASITGAGQIASAEAFGQPAVQVVVSATGITSAEAFGQPTVTASAPPQVVVDAGGIGSAEAVGSPGLTASISATGIATAEALGQPAIAARIATIAIQSAEQLGVPSVAASITATGIQTAEAFGLPSVGAPAAEISVAGIESAEAFGLPTISVETILDENLWIGGDGHTTQRRRKHQIRRQNDAIIMAIMSLAATGAFE